MSRNTLLTLVGLAVFMLMYAAGARKEIMGLTGIVALGLILGNWQEIDAQFRGLIASGPKRTTSPQATAGAVTAIQQGIHNNQPTVSFM